MTGKVRVSPAEKAERRAVMMQLKTWLAAKEKNQRWLGEKLGIYHGYVSNLLTGKQIASGEIVENARRLMGVAGSTIVVPTELQKAFESPVKKTPTRHATAAQPVLWPFPKRRYPSTEEIKMVSSITQCYLANYPGISSEELVKVVRGVKEGFVGRP